MSLKGPLPYAEYVANVVRADTGNLKLELPDAVASFSSPAPDKDKIYQEVLKTHAARMPQCLPPPLAA